ncbi:efflux RND transporter periplasmic adaptor subunit [Flavicella marina]|uniref:efflux RND transporter periplasmic adaptor subunit n=1 Tax=Flavicella marina TaxID=1475951 RepID=UPI00126480BE|nr:efflux RND transporter periplasmic adaptor subunit [Flavicella marina]
MKFSIYALFCSALLFTSCKEKQEIKLPPQKLKVFEIKAQTVPVYREFVGQVYGKSDIPIRARVEGFLEKIHFKEGSTVKKGQLLYSVDPDPFKQEVATQESRLAQSKTNLIQKESDLERVEPLAEIDAISKRELDMARAQRDAARSEVKAAEASLKLAKINLGYTDIYSPLNGLIGKTLARQGEFVGKDPNPVILNTVSRVDSIRVQFFLSENDYLLIAREYMASKEEKFSEEDSKENIQLIFSDKTVYEHKGHVDFIDRNVDPTTGAILLQASFPNPDGFIRPGQFARVKINIRNAENALLVPQKCLTELQGGYSLFVVNDKNIVENKAVQVGLSVDDYKLIKSGVSSGDRIILDGIQKVRAGMEVIPEVVEFESRKEK